MKKILIFFLILTGVLLSKEEVENQQPLQEINQETIIKDFKKEIQEYYQSPDCFFLSFKTEITVPNFGKQSAEGSVRADKIKNRMRIILIEPNLGITYSWITILQNTAYLSNPREPGVLKIPYVELKLGSFANNNIKIPFSLFQEVLFGRLPEDLLKSQVWEFNEQFIGKYRNEEGDQITFFFDKKEHKRIEKIEYMNPKTNYIGIVHFLGKFYDTKYPKSINIQTFQNKDPLETMQIHFYRYIDKAWCKDEYFPIQ